MKLNSSFSEFVEKISLGDKQHERINDAVGGLTGYLSNYFGITKDDFFLQGSYANETSVKPLEDGEYDVDLVVLCAEARQTALEALTILENALLENGTYKTMVVTNPRKESCVRLQYADEEIGGFHVDLVPARLSETEGFIEIPQRSDGWVLSNPKAYTEWCKNQGDNFLRTVKMLKRWRDFNQNVNQAIKSVTLQVIASMSFLNDETDADNLTITLSGIAGMLEQHPDSPPPVPNPVMSEEDFAERWETAHYKDFRREVLAAAVVAEQAFAEESEIQSAVLWRKLLGDDFPEAKNRSIVEAEVPELADYSHRQPVPWSHLSSSYKATVRAIKRMQAPKKGFRRKWEGPESSFSSNDIVEQNWNLYFTAQTDVPQPYTIHWQVVNTGDHARQVSGLRGGFVVSGQGDTRKESSLYIGTHWIEAFVVRDSHWIARSGPFLVRIRP